MRFGLQTVAPVAFALAVACSSSDTIVPSDTSKVAGTPVTMTVLGRGDFRPIRTTGEIFVRGTTAYTTTWGNAAAAASAFYIWDVTGDTPRLVDSVTVDNARTLGDVAVSDDGSLLIVATESPGSLVVYSLADPRHPVMVSRMAAGLALGVHTAEVGRVNGKLYAFLSIDPGSGVGGQLVIVDLSVPSSPQQVFTQVVGRPTIHDTFVRDGLLYLALWSDGVAIWDIGGGSLGGTVAAPKEIGRLLTVNGHVHNIWWLKDPVTNITRYAFIGEESPGSVGASSSGDVHVVDVSTMSAPKEVAFYTTAGAGTHNFSVDEPNGILYAAYYNGGVRALDVRGDLGTCTAAQKSTPINGTVALCDLRKMNRELGIGLLDRGNSVYVWGVQYLNGLVYASDMQNGIWKLRAVSRP
ncbi:MAG: hypothetical protein JWL61_935 [Gemmatimonadetes bacterium]|nr:hypothetical protein [Gemmatimonadota bacterium]